MAEAIGYIGFPRRGRGGGTHPMFVLGGGAQNQQIPEPNVLIGVWTEDCREIHESVDIVDIDDGNWVYEQEFRAVVSSPGSEIRGSEVGSVLNHLAVESICRVHGIDWNTSDAFNHRRGKWAIERFVGNRQGKLAFSLDYLNRILSGELNVSYASSKRGKKIISMAIDGDYEAPQLNLIEETVHAQRESFIESGRALVELVLPPKQKSPLAVLGSGVTMYVTVGSGKLKDDLNPAYAMHPTCTLMLPEGEYELRANQPGFQFILAGPVGSTDAIEDLVCYQPKTNGDSEGPIKTLRISAPRLANPNEW